MTTEESLHTFELRPLGAESMAAILEVYRQCEDFLALGPQPHASPAMVRDDLQHSADEGGCFCGIIDPAGRMLGVVDFVPRLFEGDPQCACLSLLMIAAPYRNQGLGAAVVRRVEAIIRADPHVTTIDSGVQVNNPHAIRFWQHMGYEIISGPETLPDQTTVYHLRKHLCENWLA